MRYRYLALGDLHWGAMDPQLMYDNLEYLLAFIKEMKDEIDLLVVCGDYFDYRLQLNSKAAMLAIEWFDRLVDTCKEANVKKVRIFKGTKEHDNNQLEVFRPSYEGEYVKIFNTGTLEETLPGLHVLYAPDENINLNDYNESYLELLVQHPDIGFFHGNFDVVLPQIEYDRIQNYNLPVMIYELQKFGAFIKGPIISSHWHDRYVKEPLHYIGSYDRWKFNEEPPKGFVVGTYDTETTKYDVQYIDNPLARKFITIIRTNDDCNTPLEFSETIQTINQTLEDNPGCQVRLQYVLMNEENTEYVVNLQNLQKTFDRTNSVKIVIKDLIKKRIKKQKKEEALVKSESYGYILENPSDVVNNIVRFIKDKYDVDMDIELVSSKVNPYLQ